MPPATRVMVFKRRVMVALRPAFIAAVSLFALAPQTAAAVPLASFSFSPGTPFTNDTVTFTSTSTGAVPPQRWDLDGDLACDDATGPVAQRSFWPSGAYRVTLCINDGTDESTATRRFTVQNRPPEAVINYAPFAPLSGDTITLTSTSADPDGPLVSQDWDLDGDGQFDDWRGPSASVSFMAPGVHSIGLLVTDRDRAAGAAVAEIAVRPRPPAALSPFPVVRIVGSFGTSGIRIEQLVITAPDGARIEIRCRGRGCPFKRLVRRPKPQTVRVRRFAHRTLRPGVVVEVWVTRAGEIGKYTRFRIRKAKPPSRTDMCMVPGSGRPIACPSG
jgi:hypothetical protein